MTRVNLLLIGSILLGVTAGLLADSVVVGCTAGGGLSAYGIALLENP